ncbi:PspC domain-containing protein [Humibacter sp.]|uniref:PspC domain-containing protein n=1 Tax=Humibacter sp. TaxID=1940291 RepID=UPI003F7EF975
MPEHPGQNHHAAGGPPSYGAAYPQQSSTQGGGGERFFGWLRSLGINRQNGWIGGVCGGVAARLGIDPIIVRGIAVVVAVLGGPAFLLYAAAWLMLPDAQGDIHLQRLIKGHFDPPIIAIIVIALFSFLPSAQGFWWAGAQFWGGLSWFSSVGRVLWTLLVIALIVGVVVWAARSGRVPPVTPVPRSGSPYGSPSTSPTDAGGGAAYSASASAAPASTTAQGATAYAAPAGAAHGAPGNVAHGAQRATDAASASGAGDQGDLADWRARQDAWKADYAAWTAQRDDARAIRQQRSAELRAQSQALAAEAEEARRRRRAANPRTSAAYVFIALGVALVAGGIAAAIALVGAASDYALAIALAVATGVIGLAIVIAGILRRRSGFLTFVSIVLVLVTFGAAVPPRGHELMLLPRAAYWNAQHVTIYQPVGSLELNYDTSDARRADVVQGAGDVAVQLQKGISARVVVVQHTSGSSVNATRFDDQGQTHEVAPASGSGLTHTYVFGHSTPTVDVQIDQVAGDVDLYYYSAAQ